MKFLKPSSAVAAAKRHMQSSSTSSSSTDTQNPDGGLKPITIPYHTYPDGHVLKLDLYLPSSAPTPIPQQSRGTVVLNAVNTVFVPGTLQDIGPAVGSRAADLKQIPFVIYFHGGNLLWGSRSHLPAAFIQDCLAQPFACISVSHRLLLPCTGHDILEDINHLLEFLFPAPGVKGINDHIPLTTFHRLSTSVYFVTGYSAGAYPARLMSSPYQTSPSASLYPIPSGALFISGQGGDWLSPRYVPPKEGSRTVDPSIAPWFYLSPELAPQQQEQRRTQLAVVSDLCSNTADVQGGDRVQEFKEMNLRMSVARARYQIGCELDYLTGIPGFSETLRQHVPLNSAADYAQLREVIPQQARRLFPEVMLEDVEVAREHCPVVFLHGADDRTVKMEEARKSAGQLENAGVKVRFVAPKGWGHDFTDGVWESFAKGRAV